MKRTDPESILSSLVEIDSQCTKSNNEIKNYLGDLFRDYEVQKQALNKNSIDIYNLIVKIPGMSSDNPLIFVGHTDTVPVSDKWTKNPFKLTKEQSRIYGLGVSDMKSGLACFISAALDISKKPKNDLYLLFDADEEGDGLGGRSLINFLNLEKGHIIVAEPTNRKIVYAHKGCLDATISFSGVAKHSSQADASYNEANSAIYKAIKLCNQLIAYGKEIELKKDFLGTPTMNLGVIHGGTASNVVADNCSIKICRRLVSSDSIKDEYEKLENLVHSIDSSATIIPTFWSNPFYSDPKSDVITRIISASSGVIPNPKLDIKKGCTEAGLFQKYGQVAVFGPGETQFCHTSDESLNPDDLIIFKEIYSRLIKNENP